MCVCFLPDGKVSWIRQRDLHILTTGLFTYTSDQRFSVVHRPAEMDHISDLLGRSPTNSYGWYEDWILQIRYVQQRDAGVYECQVSTEPRISQDFHLTVVGKSAVNIVN